MNCGSRFAAVCKHCSAVYRNDWLAIMRAGIFPPGTERTGPATGYLWGLVTLTAPSFGRVHRVPKHPESARSGCGCGTTHRYQHQHLAGVPIQPEGYDYAGSVRFNRDVGYLFNATRQRMKRNCPHAEFVGVLEWQARLALHLHLVVRVPLLDGDVFADIAATLRSVTSTSPVDGTLVAWGEQAEGHLISSHKTAQGSLSTTGYISKVLQYAAKDWGREHDGQSDERRAHADRMDPAAVLMPCGRVNKMGEPCEPGYGVVIPGGLPYRPDRAICPSKVHERYGLRQKQVWASRGWAFDGLNRTKQRDSRRESARKQGEKEERAAWAEASFDAAFGSSIRESDADVAGA